MTLQQLKYVVTVAEKGTLSEAAKEPVCFTASINESNKRAWKMR